MTRLERYLFRNASIATLVCLLALAGMIWISQAVRELDLVTGRGQTLLLFLQATALLLPSLVMIIAPIALFIGALYTLNKFNGDSELIVMSATGMRPRSLVRPFALLSVLVAVFCLMLTTWIMPQSARALRVIVTQVRADVITRILEEGRFVEMEKGVVFHYRSKTEDGGLKGVLFQDRRAPDIVATYLAEVGRVVEIDDAGYLVLERGSLQRQNVKEEENAVVGFDRYAVDLEQLSGADPKVVYRPRERRTLDLLTTSYDDPRLKSAPGRVRSELHDRFSAPLFALAAGAIAFAALGAPRTTRQGRGLAIFIAIVVIVLLRSGAFGASTLAVRTPYGVWLMYALPLGATVAALIFAFRQFSPRKAFAWPFFRAARMRPA
jgi:lipopolysaccharide export system permease protein